MVAGEGAEEAPQALVSSLDAAVGRCVREVAAGTLSVPTGEKAQCVTELLRAVRELEGFFVGVQTTAAASDTDVLQEDIRALRKGLRDMDALVAEQGLVLRACLQDVSPPAPAPAPTAAAAQTQVPSASEANTTEPAVAAPAPTAAMDTAP